MAGRYDKRRGQPLQPRAPCDLPILRHQARGRFQNAQQGLWADGAVRHVTRHRGFHPRDTVCADRGRTPGYRNGMDAALRSVSVINNPQQAGARREAGRFTRPGVRRRPRGRRRRRTAGH